MTRAPRVLGVTRDGVKVLTPKVRSKNFTPHELERLVAEAKRIQWEVDHAEELLEQDLKELEERFGKPKS